MAKIQNPQDEKGILLINKTTFDTTVERIENNLDAEILRSTSMDTSLQESIDQVAFVVADEIDRATKAEISLNSKISENKDTISNIQTSISNLETNLKVNEYEIERVDFKIETVNTRINELEDKVSFAVKINDVRGTKERIIAYKNSENGTTPLNTIDELYKIDFVLSKGGIFTYNAVVSNPDIATLSDITDNPTSGMQQISYNLTFNAVPATNTVIYIILDSICGEAGTGADSQHVTHILPIEIIVNPEN